MAAPNRTATWSPEAIADLDAIWSYYERVAGRSTAEKIAREIGQLVATIEAHPFAGRGRDSVGHILPLIGISPAFAGVNARYDASLIFQ